MNNRILYTKFSTPRAVLSSSMDDQDGKEIFAGLPPLRSPFRLACFRGDLAKCFCFSFWFPFKTTPKRGTPLCEQAARMDQDARVAENLLRLGRPMSLKLAENLIPAQLGRQNAQVADVSMLQSRKLNLAALAESDKDRLRFCQRFEVLARSGAAAGSAALVPALL